jgi:hypothetical protein
VNDRQNILDDIDKELTGHGYRRLDPQLEIWVPGGTAVENWPRVGDTAILVVAYVRERGDTDEEPEFYSIVLVARSKRPAKGHSWDVRRRVAITPVSFPEAAWTAAWWARQLSVPLALRPRDLSEVTRKVYLLEIEKGENSD